MGVYLYRTENVLLYRDNIASFTHGLGVAPAGENGEVFLRHRTATYCATVLVSNSQVVSLRIGGALPLPDTGGIAVDLCVMAFHSVIK